MFGLGSGGAAPAKNDLIKDVDEATFMADVVEASKEVPVIVDFWAPWCGPCKTLGPALEAAVTAAGGKVKLVKVDVDKNQRIAGQMRVQSIPAVFAFVDGQPVDGFMGNVGPSELKDFIDRVAAQGPDGGLADAIAAAEEMLETGAAADAAQTFAAILGEEPENLQAIGGLARAYLAAGDAERAKETLDLAPADKASDSAIAAARAAIELAADTADAGEAEELRAKLQLNQDDHQTRLDLAVALLAAKDPAAAVDELLELFRRDREWNDGAARTQLMKIFDSLPPNDPVALKGRRRLSSMIFA
jgi:putative thioredoxin